METKKIKDFDMEKVMHKMSELREKRELEILNKEFNDEKELKNIIVDVKYLGKIDWEEEINGVKTISDKEIYLIIEQKEDEKGNTINIERYYTEDGEFIGGNNKSDEYDFIMLNEKYMDKPKLAEKLQDLEKEGILDLNKLEQERLEEIAELLEIKPNEIDKLAEIDIEEIEKANEKLDNKSDEILTKQQVNKIATKTEIDINQKITDRDTIGSVLNIQGQGFKKVAVIYSDKMQENNSTTKFSIVGIKEDGSAHKIDTLEQEYGKAPNKEINSLNRDGSKIEDKQMNSIYKIKGQNEKQLGINIGAAGTIEANLIRTPRQNNQEAISIPIETHSIKHTTKETRELMNQQKNVNVNEEIERINQHQEIDRDCDGLTIENIDDNPYNNTHIHLSEAEMDMLADKLLKNEEIDRVFTKNEVKQTLKKSLENSKEKTIEETINEVEKQLEEDASHIKTRETM